MTWLPGCPRDTFPAETYQIVSAWAAYMKGHTPVTLGRAPWLPGVFEDAVNEVQAAHAQGEREAAERRNASRKKA